MKNPLCGVALGFLVGCAPIVAPLQPVPEVVRAVDTDPSPDGVEIHLVAADARFDIVSAGPTDGLAYRDASSGARGAMPGPLIEVMVGQTLTVWLTNGMPSLATTLHFHGMRVPVELDGNPLVSGRIDPDETVLHRFVVRDPGLYWFHPHLFSDEHTELGLQGLVLVHAPDEPQASRERVFVLDDVDLAADGSMKIAEDANDHLLGRSGDTLLVNGHLPGTIRAVAGAVERWHIVNTANGRHFALARSDGGPFEVIGWDGPALAEPYHTHMLALAPGERRDVLVRLDGVPGESLVIETVETQRAEGMGEWERALLFRVDLAEGDPGVTVRGSDFAREVERLPVSTATVVRPVVLEVNLPDHRMMINGEVWPFGPPIDGHFGDVEVWEVQNLSGLPHPFHVHGTFFQVLARNGVGEERLGFRDTVAIGPRETLRLALRYDAMGRWMFHCQLPEHMHMGMMADLLVRE